MKTEKSNARDDTPVKRELFGFIKKKPIASFFVGLTAAAAAIVSLTGMSPLELIDKSIQKFESRQPHHDQKILNDLRTDISINQFSKTLETESIGIIKEDVGVQKYNSTVKVHSELFVLDTVYVEGFVSERGSVIGYTVISKDEKAPQDVKAGAYDLSLGKTLISEVPFAGVSHAGGGCGVHATSYFEVGLASNAVGNQIVAVGFSDTGYLPDEMGAKAICDTYYSMSTWDATPALEHPSTDKYTISYYIPSRSFIENSSDRKNLLINSFTVMAPGFDLSPSIISTHPDEIRTRIASS